MANPNITSSGMPCSLVWSTSKDSYRQAEALDFKLKNLSRARKIKFMKKYPDGIEDLGLLSIIENKLK